MPARTNGGLSEVIHDMHWDGLGIKAKHGSVVIACLRRHDAIVPLRSPFSMDGTKTWTLLEGHAQNVVKHERI